MLHTPAGNAWMVARAFIRSNPDDDKGSATRRCIRTREPSMSRLIPGGVAEGLRGGVVSRIHDPGAIIAFTYSGEGTGGGDAAPRVPVAIGPGDRPASMPSRDGTHGGSRLCDLFKYHVRADRGEMVIYAFTLAMSHSRSRRERHIRADDDWWRNRLGGSNKSDH